MSIYVDITKELGSFRLESRFEAGNEKLGLLGGSGCGKSMTLKCIAGVVTPDKGEIILNDRILFSSKKNINLIPQKRNVGLMFQSYALFPNMTVYQNISVGMSEKTSEEKKKIIERYLDLFKLGEVSNLRPHQLSGGQQQRVALARIMAKSPDILMLDEPFSALDTHLRFSIESEFADALNNYNGTVIYVSHSVEEVYKFCDSTAVMDNGRIFEKDATEKIFSNPTTLEGAKLTGCKNISSVQILEDGAILALDWGITFKIKSSICKDIKYIGIREDSISISNSCHDENSFEVSIIGIKKLPFDTMLEIVPKATKVSGQNNRIICKYNNEDVKKIIGIEKQCKIHATIDMKNILLLK